MHRWGRFDEFISASGGIVSRAELLAAGWSADAVRFGVQLGSLHRLCRGWYGSSDLPAEVRSAWSHGGPLACVSALAFHGVIDQLPRQQAPHVCRGSRSHRLRHTNPATIHWSDEAYSSGTRWSVSIESALAQAARCAPDLLPDDERERRTPPPWPWPLDTDLTADTAV